MHRFNFNLTRRALIACVITASLIAVPTSLAAPAGSVDSGHWLSMSYLTDLAESLGHWVADFSSADDGEVSKDDPSPTPQTEDPTLSTSNTTDRGADVGPSLDPTG